jgi:hypothetical protein
MHLVLVVGIAVFVVVSVVLVVTSVSEPCAGCGRQRLIRQRLPFGQSIGCACSRMTRSRR